MTAGVDLWHRCRMKEEPPPLLPQSLREALPPLYSTEKAQDPLVHAKLLTPWADWTWFIMEFDGEDTAFGLVAGHEVELGYFSLSEIAALQSPAGLRVERDLRFRAKPLSQVRNELGRKRGGPEGLEASEGAEAYGGTPPAPIDQPGFRLIETALPAGGLSASFGSVATPSAAASILHSLIGKADCEHFAALLLNSRHQVTHAQVISRGCLNSTLVHPREVFKAAVLANAAAIIVGHNHPSGGLVPSPEDRDVNDRLAEVGKVLGISLLDSLIVGPGPEFYATSLNTTCPLEKRPAQHERPPAQVVSVDVCRGLLQDIGEVLERQGEEWWDETVTSGTRHRDQAERLLGRATYAAPRRSPEIP